MQSILDLNLGWSSLDGRLVSRVVAIVGSQQLVNVTRPALHILRKLIAAEVRKDRPVCGYSAVWLYMSADTAFFKAIATRLARESDKLLMSSALALLNAIMRNVTADLFYETIDTLEKYNFRKAVIVSLNFNNEFGGTGFDFSIPLVTHREPHGRRHSCYSAISTKLGKYMA